jgi:hypothetical protein
MSCGIVQTQAEISPRRTNRPLSGPSKSQHRVLFAGRLSSTVTALPDLEVNKTLSVLFLA